MPTTTGMGALLLYAAVLAAAALLSGRAARTAYSNNALFLGAGLMAGLAGLLPRENGDVVLRELADLALFAILFSDGMRLSPRELGDNWRLPARALIIGMPATWLAIAGLALLVTDLSWPEALLVGAVLSPTDPVFASALVGRKAVPLRLRRLLNIESGLNDGLATPLVFGVLHWMGAAGDGLAALALDIVLGVGLGVVVSWLALRLRRLACDDLPGPHATLFIIAVALSVLAIARLTQANEYVAAFCGGIVMARRERTRMEFDAAGERISELLKFAALLAFGALASGINVSEVGWSGLLLGGGALVLARPVAIGLALIGTQLSWRERASAAWFGPKGFASIVYAIALLHTSLDRARHVFDITACVVLLSILAHSATDVLVARRFEASQPH